MNNFKKNIFKTVLEELILYTYLAYDGSNQPGENATCTAYNDIGGGIILYSTNDILTLGNIYYINYEGGPLEIYNGLGYVHYFPSENKLVTINNIGEVTLISNCETSPPTTPYCITWEAHNLSNIKMSTTGFIDFTELMAGRTISTGASIGTLTGFIIAGSGTITPCSIPMTFSSITNKVSWNTDTLPITTDKVLTSLIYTVELVFTNASEYTIVDGQSNAIVEEGVQLDSYYNDCTG